MASLEHITKKMHEHREREGPVELTPKRMRRLKSTLKILKDVVETNAIAGSDNPRLTRYELEEVGAMDYLLTQLFPDGKVPDELKPYAEFVSRIRGIDVYHDVFEDKLQRDAKMLKKKNSVAEADDPVYARTLIDVIEADEITPGRSRLVVAFEGQTLYEENLPNYAFRGLPKGSTVVFEYTSQGLTLSLRETLEESSKIKINVPVVEKIVIESLASDIKTKGYVDSLYDQINEELAK